MVPISLTDVVVVVLGLEVLGVGTWAAWAKGRRAAIRSQQLHAAATALGAHYSATEVFLEAEGAPDDLKEKLLWYSDLMGNRETATRLAQSLCSDEPEPEDSPLLSELNRLRSERAELADAFEKAFFYGIVGMFLQWPETAALFERFAAKFGFFRARDTAIVASRMSRMDRPSGGALGGRAVYA